VVDFILGIGFAALAIRGWMRGFVKELMDLVGMVLGAVLGLGFSAQAGRFIESWSGASPGASRIVGGFGLFMIAGLGASIGAHYLGKVFNRTGLKTSNRLLGSVFAFGWGWVVATVVLSVVLLLPLPDSWEEALGESTLASAVTDPDQPALRAFRSFTGDRSLSSALSLDALLHDQNIVVGPEEVFPIEAASAEDLERVSEFEQRILELVNLERREAGLRPLTWNQRLADVGHGHANEMYIHGYFAHESPITGSVVERVDAVGVKYRLVGENLALAATAEIAHEGLMESPGHRENVLRADFREVGIAVVEGPLGLMVVQVFTG
jgi:uncharacterized protein YkwD/uncharacterized membrane protein required for colicin V production